MRKLLLLICALLTSVSGAWADDITVNLVDGKTNGTAHNPIGTLMGQNGTTLTSNAAAGLAGVVLSNVANSGQGTWKVNNVDQRQLTIKPSAGKTAEKITITAPQGYIITGYSISCCNFSTSCTYKIDKSDTYNASTATSISNYSTYTTIDATFPSLPLTASTTNTASFWIYANAETASVNWLMINEFKVTLKQVTTPPTSLTSGWYQLKWVDTAGASDYENADVNGKYVFNYATDVTVSSNDYALYLGDEAPSTLSEHATTFVYVNKDADQGSYGISGNLQSANGRYISRSGASSLTAPSDKNYIIFYSAGSYPVNSVITSATSGSDRISLVPQGKNATSYIGQTNAADKYPMVQFWPVNLSDYNIQAWTVSILDPAGTHDAGNTQVTYTGSNLYGLNKVYHNGTFFIASGTTPSASDFTAPVKGGVTPVFSVDATNHIVTAIYSVNVTYKMMFNGSEITSARTVVTEDVGTTASTPSAWTTPAYCSFTCPATEITAETSEIEVTLTWDGPFEFSADYANANWCYLKMHGQYLIYSGSSATPNSLGDLASAESAASKAFWAFVGDPFNGFQLINKAAGSDKNLAVKWWNPNMDTQETKWLLQSWNSDFALHTSSYFYLNNADGQLKLWVSGTSVEAMNFDCAIESVSYKGLALDFIDDYANDHALGQYFGVSTESYNFLRNSFAEAESVSAKEYTSLESNISVYLSPKLPETGYYRIKSSGSRGDQSYITYGYLDDSKGTGLLTTIGNKETDLGTVVKLTRVLTSKNYKISIQGLNVQAHSGDNTLFRATGAEGLNFQFNHINFSGMCSIYDGTNHGNMHEADWKKPDTGLNGVVGWDAGDGTNASSWCLEDASTIEVTLNNGGDGFYYATCFTDFPVSYTGASNGEGLFVLTGGESNGKVTAQKVAAVPAQQGFLIRLAAENVTDSKVTLTIPASAEALTGTNVLTGTCLATTKPDGNVYVFSKVGDDLGFFPYTGSDIPANRAYIVEPAGSGTRSFILSFDETTGLNGVSTSTPAGTIFDMQGRRVNKAEKGLYIVNGKKVLF